MATPKAPKRKDGEVDATALASVAPFLEGLFENANAPASHGASYGSMNASSVGPANVTPMSYPDAVRRETSKPFAMNTAVSTDFAPLPTRTAGATFTEFSRSYTTSAHPSELTYNYRSTLQAKYTADHRLMTHFNAEDIDRMHDVHREHAALPPPQYREPHATRSLQDAHVVSLLDAIHVAKVQAFHRRPPTVQ